MPDQTPLEGALSEACAFAIAHDVGEITPADFAIRRAAPGVTHATYVDVDSVVSVVIDQDGRIEMAVGEMCWLHNESDKNRDLCDYCEVVEPREFVDVYLPGDAPEVVEA